MEKANKPRLKWPIISDNFLGVKDFWKQLLSIRNKFVLPILNYYDEKEKEKRQTIIDNKTNLKRSNLIDE